MIRGPPRSTLDRSSAASDVYKRQDVMRTTKLPSVLGEFEPDGKTYFSVRQTRFGVKSSTPTSIGTLKKFEFENAIIVGAMLNQYIAF